MNNLTKELRRLYFFDDQQWQSQKSEESGNSTALAAGALTPAILTKCLAGETGMAINLVSPGGTVRVMVVNFKKASDWEAVANLHQAVQDELDLPAPALSVSGRKGYRLWFSLAEPIPVAPARDFLKALRRRYLADLPAANLELRPDTDTPACIKLVPARHSATGKWSAFIDPSLGGMFVDEPGLEMAPNMDRQAGILAGLESIKPADFQSALNILATAAEAATGIPALPGERSANLPGEAAGQPGLDPGRSGSRLNVGSNYSDPKSFLLAVMNDASASARAKIKAAEALLPYFAKSTPE